MILSIDVGIRNLALCIMSFDKKIHLWDVYNILESDDHKCLSLLKNGKVCNKICSFKYEEQYSCKIHIPKSIVARKYKKKLIKNYPLQEITKLFLKKINTIHNDNAEVFNKVTKVLIELQPKMNPKMKLVSHILFGKMVEIFKDLKTKVLFVKASNKLKNCHNFECKLKGAYARRKWLAIENTRLHLETEFCDEQKDKWLPFFEGCSKKDDISDVFLYAFNHARYLKK